MKSLRQFLQEATGFEDGVRIVRKSGMKITVYKNPPLRDLKRLVREVEFQKLRTIISKDGDVFVWPANVYCFHKEMGAIINEPHYVLAGYVREEGPRADFTFYKPSPVTIAGYWASIKSKVHTGWVYADEEDDDE
jgi:hypothetical protein